MEREGKSSGGRLSETGVATPDVESKGSDPSCTNGDTPPGLVPP